MKAQDGLDKLHLLSGLAIAYSKIADTAGLLRATAPIIVIRIAQTFAFRLALVVTLLLLLGACAATQIITQWSNPSYTAASFNRILVIGVSKQASIRRTFEDEFVAQLRPLGVEAVPSYEVIPEDGQVLEPRLRETVQQIGADAVLMTRLVRVEKKADVAPGPYGPFPGFGFYRWYSSAWVGFYEPPRANFYDIYLSETSLYDVAKDRLVWSGIAKTTDLGDIGKEMKEYVEVVIRALNKKNLLTNQNRRVG